MNHIIHQKVTELAQCHKTILSKCVCLLKVAHVILTLMLVYFGTCYAQGDSTFTFEGRLLDENSIPIENAYLINYRSLEFCLTDKDGWFDIPVMPGDSFKTYHISYDPIIVEATDSVAFFQLPVALYDLLEPNIMRKKTSIYDKILLDNFDENWDRMMYHMQKELSYLPSREKPDHPRDSINGAPISPLMNNFKMSGRDLEAGLSVDAVYNKLKKLMQNRSLKHSSVDY